MILYQLSWNLGRHIIFNRRSFECGNEVSHALFLVEGEENSKKEIIMRI